MRIHSLDYAIFFIFLSAVFHSCISKKEISVLRYYEYDQKLPLEDTVKLISDSTTIQLYSVSFASTHNQRVKGLLSVPKNTDQVPIIILLHGLGDRKTVDYIEAGHKYFIDSGYAVLRIDIANHGDRKKHDYDFDLVDGYRYWTRDLIAQTVFDLRRTIDFINTRKELNSNRIGFFGISLGGMIGTVFSGVDDRVKVPIIVLAGGNLNLMFGLNALTNDAKEFFSFIDPINFVKEIAPRPFLMINAEKDEVVAPITSKMLFKKAEKPKKIIWYDSYHRNLPIDKAYPDGIQWFQEYL